MELVLAGTPLNHTGCPGRSRDGAGGRRGTAVKMTHGAPWGRAVRGEAGTPRDTVGWNVCGHA